MDRLIRLQRLWSWLPAFRAVAETEHLHDAASRLHLTPSTLSRAVHLLEDDLGKPLFRRSHRAMTLTPDGRVLVAALREAMRRLDDALVAIASPVTTSIRIACSELVASIAVVRAIDHLRAAHPRTEVSLFGLASDMPARLFDGSIDVAFVTAVGEHADLVVERVGTLAHSVYRATHATAASYIHAAELPWPPDQLRDIGVRVQSAAMARSACEAGLGRAMLPDAVAAGLVRVDGTARADVAIYAVRRTAIGASPILDQLVAAVVEQLGRAGNGSCSTQPE